MSCNCPARLARLQGWQDIERCPLSCRDGCGRFRCYLEGAWDTCCANPFPRTKAAFLLHHRRFHIRTKQSMSHPRELLKVAGIALTCYTDIT
ncbi:protein of unknown function [Burkholderia multivorans]